MRRRRRLILITPGDPAGIGPEIVSKTWRRSGRQSLRSLYPDIDFVCVGSRAPFDRMKVPVHPLNEADLNQELDLPSRGLPLLCAPESAPRRKGKALHLEGYQSGWSIEKATRLIQAGKASAIVTGPISKSRLQQGGFQYSGHTDFLADLCGVRQVTMMLANDQLRISLVTVHIGVKDVPRQLTSERLRTAILHTTHHLRDWWGIRKPRVAVAALNPHAGEDGLFGDEEIRVISPEIRSLQKSSDRRGFVIEGPLPADTLFANHVMTRREDRFDAVICMYHDQGLIPVKLLDFPRTVNVTLGLPIVRTSVDHGVAFDIAGQGKADPSSLQSAIGLAASIVRNRSKKRS